MRQDDMILVFSMLSFKPTFSLSSFTFIKKLFSSSSLSADRVVSSAYLRLLIFPPALLIPACAYSSPAFLIIYSAYRLNKQGDNIQPWCTHSFSYLEPVCCSMSSSNCCFLTCIQISQEAGHVVWYSHLFKNFHLLRSLPFASIGTNSLSYPPTGSVPQWTATGTSPMSRAQTPLHADDTHIFFSSSNPSLYF